jgi:hypothetical protein
MVNRSGKPVSNGQGFEKPAFPLASMIFRPHKTIARCPLIL